MFHRTIMRLFAFAWISLVAISAAQAQEEAEAKPPKLPEIADEPKTVDPAELVPEPLRVQVTHDLSDSSLRELVEWLQAEQNLVVLMDASALADIGISPAEPISDRLNQTPLFLLLNRLRSMGLDWYFEEEILYLTSTERAEEKTSTLPYNVGDLLDAGYKLEDLAETVQLTAAPECWEDAGGNGMLSMLGDVLFVRQTDRVHRQVQGLLTALRKHGRQTFVNDPVQHQTLRAKLDANISADFTDMPLETAIAQLGQQAGIDLRLDLPELRNARVREREPVTLKLKERKLETVLQAMVLDLGLTWILRDGVLWVTSKDQAEGFLKTAVYDVRDLCRDESEAYALLEAVMSQTAPSSWDDNGGEGQIVTVKPGTVAIRQREDVHREVLALLETYRTALRASKPRDRDAEDPDEVITVYYRMYEKMADDLRFRLPTLIRPESWKGPMRMEAPGEMTLVASAPDISHTAGEGGTSRAMAIGQAVLIIRQTRAAHDEIASAINRVQFGDMQEAEASGMGGGGGFGGGFFSVPLRERGK